MMFIVYGCVERCWWWNHGVLQHVTKLSTTDIKFEVNGKMGFVSHCYIIKILMVPCTKALKEIDEGITMKPW